MPETSSQPDIESLARSVVENLYVAAGRQHLLLEWSQKRG
jgi:hypothetical protein